MRSSQSWAGTPAVDPPAFKGKLDAPPGWVAHTGAEARMHLNHQVWVEALMKMLLDPIEGDRACHHEGP
jgi:hypothetical protein